MQTRQARFNQNSAKEFSGYSTNSMKQTFEAIEVRRESDVHASCECKPYNDVFTFDRWTALGFSVLKGEKALRIESWVPIKVKSEEGETKTEADSQTERTRLKPHTMHLFCRCQVGKTPARN